jgi:hypothetical protein
MSRRGASEHVGDIHIAQAVSAGKPAVVISSFGNDDSVLSMPRLPTRTQAQKAEAERQEAEDALLAARCTARYLMLRGHRCTGQGCRKRAHEGGLGALRELLAMLGLREEAPKGKRGGPRRFET